MNSVRVTSALLWRCALIVGLVDAPLVLLVAKWVPSGLFAKLKWHLAGSAFIVYSLLWGAFGSVYFWDSVYQAVFPGWFHWLLPLGFGTLYGLLAIAFWHGSRLAPRGQVVCFILFGGMASLAGHAIGISRGLLRVPMLVEASPLSALVFGVFEFIFYWTVIIAMGVAGWWLERRVRRE